MPRRSPAAAALAITLLAGCAEPVQKGRSLRELYEVQAEVDKTAEPYDLGTGSPSGRVNHRRSGASTQPSDSRR